MYSILLKIFEKNSVRGPLPHTKIKYDSATYKPAYFLKY